MSKRKEEATVMEYDSSEEDDNESSSGDEEANAGPRPSIDLEPSRVYLPGAEMEDGEHLECDQSAYAVYHQANTGAPCLSFDIIVDELGADRADDYPLSGYFLGGTQSEKTHLNNLILVKFSKLHPNKKRRSVDDEDDDDDDDSGGEDELPEMQHAMIPHKGCVNRVKVKNVGSRCLAASWSELKTVNIWDLSIPLEAVDKSSAMGSYVRNKEAPKPLFTFRGHQDEGFAVDWSNTQTGVLATGDCKRNIHIWTPQEGSTWTVDQRPLVGHTDSVEDLQWSPNEPNVLCSCSADGSIRIWDTRASPSKACMLSVNRAHESDVNVINWNRIDPFVLSGGDDGHIKVWDLRQFEKGTPVCVFKHHTAPITSVEWHPKESTVFAASGEDDQLTLWDLSVEKDSTEERDLPDLAPQLLFIHQGQKDIKELHWHPQMPGLLLSTAHSGFNVFRTISV